MLGKLPFGEIDANRLLVDGQLKLHFTVNELLKRNLARSRPLIVGRKGTGKITLKLAMRSYTDRYAVCRELNIGKEYPESVTSGFG